MFSCALRAGVAARAGRIGVAGGAGQLLQAAANICRHQVDVDPAGLVEAVRLLGQLAHIGARRGVVVIGGARLDPRQLVAGRALERDRSAEHTSELPSLMRISSAVFCLTKKTT